MLQYGHGCFAHKQAVAVGVALFAVFQCVDEKFAQLGYARWVFVQHILVLVRVVAQIKVQLPPGLGVPDVFILFCQDEMHGILAKRMLAVQIFTLNRVQQARAVHGFGC